MVFGNYEIYYNNITMYIEKYTTNILLMKKEITLSQHWKHYYSYNFISSTRKHLFDKETLYIYPLSKTFYNIFYAIAVC